MAADGRGSVARHHADDQGADHRNRNHPQAEVAYRIARRDELPADPAIERDVRDQPDQGHQRLGDKASRDAE